MLPRINTEKRITVVCGSMDQTALVVTPESALTQEYLQKRFSISNENLSEVSPQTAGSTIAIPEDGKDRIAVQGFFDAVRDGAVYTFMNMREYRYRQSPTSPEHITLLKENATLYDFKESVLSHYGMDVNPEHINDAMVVYTFEGHLVEDDDQFRKNTFEGLFGFTVKLNKEYSSCVSDIQIRSLAELALKLFMISGPLPEKRRKVGQFASGMADSAGDIAWATALSDEIKIDVSQWKALSSEYSFLSSEVMHISWRRDIPDFENMTIQDALREYAPKPKPLDSTGKMALEAALRIIRYMILNRKVDIKLALLCFELQSNKNRQLKPPNYNFQADTAYGIYEELQLEPCYTWAKDLLGHDFQSQICAGMEAGETTGSGTYIVYFKRDADKNAVNEVVKELKGLGDMSN